VRNPFAYSVKGLRMATLVQLSGTTLCYCDSEEMTPTDRVSRQDDREVTIEIN